MRMLAALAGGLAMMGMAMAEEAYDPDLTTILEQRVAEERAIGLAGAVVDGEGVRFGAAGTTTKAGAIATGPDTVFEIGSITKVFTALLLADAVRRGEVKLDQPVRELLPEGSVVPARNGREITLIDLATHTSGLPRMPDNFAPASPLDPYVDYDPARLAAFLSTYELPRDIGVTMEYSNLGYGLLGHVLALRAGTDYGALVKARILDPLEMTDTAIGIAGERRERLAQGYDAAGEPSGNWGFDVMAGAGALTSTPRDMAKFVAAAMSEEGPLAEAFADMLAVRRPTGQANMEIGLGWLVMAHGDDEIVWHNGGTGGYRSFAGFLREGGRGAVVLTNMSTEIGVDDVGMHVLDAKLPLAPPPVKRTEVPVEADVLAGYVGRYALAPEFVLDVTTEGGRLFVQATGQDRIEVYPESATAFFYKVVDAQITFEVDAVGRATGLVLHQHGQNMPGQRLE